MSQHDHDFDEVLRRALHAAADSVQPAGDGLERIRARLTRPVPLPVAWVMASYRSASGAVLSRLRLLATWMEPAAARLRPVLGPAVERVRPVWSGGARLQHRYAWLRPAAAAATVVAVVAMGALALKELPQAISPAASNQSITNGQPGSHPGNTAEDGNATPFASTGPAGVAPNKGSGTPKSGCSPSTSASPSPTVSPSPSASGSPRPSPSPRPTPSPSRSPSPTGGPSPDSGQGTTAPGAGTDSAAATTSGRGVILSAEIVSNPASSSCASPSPAASPSSTSTVKPVDPSALGYLGRPQE